MMTVYTDNDRYTSGGSCLPSPQAGCYQLIIERNTVRNGTMGNETAANVLSCIYGVLNRLYCVFFVLFRLCIFIICFVCTTVRTTAIE